MRSLSRLLMSAFVLCVLAATAAAEPANLTPMERQLLVSRGLLDVGVVTEGPVYYVAPGIRVRETLAPPLATSSDVGSLRTQLMQSRPFGTNSTCAQTTGPLINGGFEDGSFNGWTTSGQAGTGSPSVCGGVMPPEATITSPGLQPFANLDPLINRVWQNNHAAMLGDSIAWGFDSGSEPQCNSVTQSVVIPAGTANFNFAYAVLASNPGHGFGSDPYFHVQVRDVTTNTLLYDVIDYTTSYDPLHPCDPWCLGAFDPMGLANVVYRRWTQVSLDLSGIAGHVVTVSLQASDCSPSAHFCEAFLDGGSITCPDSIGPDPVQLSASCAPDSGCASFCATLNWTAPGDPSACADSLTLQCSPTTLSAAAYDVRWSTSPIVTAADFAAANQAAGEPVPAAPGTGESFVLCGLPQGTVYVALQSSDASFNTSSVATAQTDCQCNQPPDCSAAVACVEQLWPPNHQFVGVSICGVTDPDGDPVTITATAIRQDEPLNTRGDGNTCPDGRIVNGEASVRAERSGTPGNPGNGRVYAISFTADDGRGGTCDSIVYVCVPHDQGAHATCVDDGLTYNSLGSCNGGANLTAEVIEYGLMVGTTSDIEATLEFALPQAGPVEVAVFDVAGRRLATLEKGTLEPGVYQRTWNMAGAAKGLYFVRLKAGATTLSKTVVKIQ